MTQYSDNVIEGFLAGPPQESDVNASIDSQRKNAIGNNDV